MTIIVNVAEALFPELNRFRLHNPYLSQTYAEASAGKIFDERSPKKFIVSRNVMA